MVPEVVMTAFAEQEAAVNPAKAVAGLPEKTGATQSADGAWRRWSGAAVRAA